MKKLAALFFIGAIYLACHQKSASPASSGADMPLENTHWKLIALSSLPGNFPSLTKDAYLELKAGKATGFSGCNNYFGSYKLSNNSIQFSGIGMTKMFCMGTMEVENGLSQALTDVDQFRITGNHLELLKNSNLLARFEGSAMP